MAVSGCLLSAGWLQNVSRCKEGSALADFLYFLKTSVKKIVDQNLPHLKALLKIVVSVFWLGSLTISITECDHKKP